MRVREGVGWGEIEYVCESVRERNFEGEREGDSVSVRQREWLR